jgi:hypothetical protein
VVVCGCLAVSGPKTPGSCSTVPMALWFLAKMWYHTHVTKNFTKNFIFKIFLETFVAILTKLFPYEYV